MHDPTDELFYELGRRGHESILEDATGRIRFDLSHDDETDHWLLDIVHGDVAVSREMGPADSIIRTDRELFHQIVLGRENMYSAWLRHRVVIEGDSRLARYFELILPPPPEARHPRLAYESGRRQQ